MSVLSGLFFKEMYELLIGECQTVRNNGVSVERGSTVLESVNTPQTADQSYISKKPGEVRRLGGNLSNCTDLLCQFELQFGRFRGKTFK